MSGVISESRFLVIGGANKSGTTSLHRWLGSHPDVCASSVKETRFFLDDDYPLPRHAGLNDGAGKYLDFFAGGNRDSLFVEATPDYLYNETPLTIPSHLPNAQFLFVLRDPVDRFVSSYRFAQQQGLVSGEMNVASFYERQVQDTPAGGTPVQWRALEQGRYAHYLGRWYERVDAASIKIASFDSLQSDPAALLRDVCAFAGLDAGFYDEFGFEQHNPTKGVRYSGMRRGYEHVRRRVSFATLRHGRLRAVLQSGNRALKRLLAVNEKRPSAVEMPEALASELREYYAQDTAALRTLPGCADIHWSEQ